MSPQTDSHMVAKLSRPCPACGIDDTDTNVIIVDNKLAGIMQQCRSCHTQYKTLFKSPVEIEIVKTISNQESR